jgi:hypothetical protein
MDAIICWKYVYRLSVHMYAYRILSNVYLLFPTPYFPDSYYYAVKWYRSLHVIEHDVVKTHVS